MSIFDKDSFTLKEFCTFLLNIKNFSYFTEIYGIIMCYINFSSGNNNYRKFLINTRNNRGIIYIDKLNNKKIILRELLQLFDFEFTKLVIRIKTDCKNYDINISWIDFEDKLENISKLEFKNFIEINSE